MPPLGTLEWPLRVAIVGAGPAGFFAAAALLRSGLKIQIALFEQAPIPYGLVRYGVAPDHQELKRVTAAFAKTATSPGVEWVGNVCVGHDLSLADLQAHFDAVLLATGARGEQTPGVPGEDLPGVFSGNAFVGWYNADPTHRLIQPDLATDTAVIVGNGNVAIDVARILLQAPDRLAPTDISAPALAALRQSRIRRVVLLGRRGPMQASFTHAEVQEVLHLPDLSVQVHAGDLLLDPADRTEGEAHPDPRHLMMLADLQVLAAAPPRDGSRHLEFRFLRSPVALHGRDRVEEMTVSVNRLAGPPAQRRAEPTGQTETIPCGLVVACIGFRGLPVPGAPFDSARGCIPNDAGRVRIAGVPWLYAAGWCKNGPRGLIGTAKKDSSETAATLLTDVPRLRPAPQRETEPLIRRLRGAGVRVTTFADWQRLDAIERERGTAAGKVREKIDDFPEMLRLLGSP